MKKNTGEIEKKSNKMVPAVQNVKEIQEECIDMITEEEFQEVQRIVKIVMLVLRAEKKLKRLEEHSEMQKIDDRMFKKPTTMVEQIEEKEESLDPLSDMQKNDDTMSKKSTTRLEQVEKVHDNWDQLSDIEKKNDMFKKPTRLERKDNIQIQERLDQLFESQKNDDSILKKSARRLEQVENQQDNFGQPSEMEKNDYNMFKKLTTKLEQSEKKEERIDQLSEIQKKDDSMFKKPTRRLEPTEEKQERLDQLSVMQKNDDSMFEKTATKLEVEKKLERLDQLSDMQINDDSMFEKPTTRLKQTEEKQKRLDQLSEMQKKNDSTFKKPITRQGQIEEASKEILPDAPNLKQGNGVLEENAPQDHRISEKDHIKVNRSKKDEKFIENMEKDSSVPNKTPQISGQIKEASKEILPDVPILKQASEVLERNPHQDHQKSERSPEKKRENTSKREERFIDNLEKERKDRTAPNLTPLLSASQIEEARKNIRLKFQNLKQANEVMEKNARQDHKNSEKGHKRKSMTLFQSSKNDKRYIEHYEKQRKDTSASYKTPQISAGQIQEVSKEILPGVLKLRRANEVLGKNSPQDQKRWKKGHRRRGGNALKKDERFIDLLEKQRKDGSVAKKMPQILGAIKKSSNKILPDVQNVKKNKEECVDVVAEQIYQENLKHLKMKELGRVEEKQKSRNELPEMQINDDGANRKIGFQILPNVQNVQIKTECLDVVAEHKYQQDKKNLKTEELERVEKKQESFDQLPTIQRIDDSMFTNPTTSLVSGAIKKIGHEMGPDDQNVKKIKKDCVDPIAEHIYQENLKYLKKQELDHVEKRQESCDQLPKKQRENDSMYENLTSLGKIKKIKHKIVFDDETDKKIKEECLDVVADQINQENLKYLKIQASEGVEKNQESFYQLPEMQTDDDSMLKKPSTSLGAIKKIGHKMGPDDQNVKKIKKDCVDPIAEHIYQENLKYLKKQELDHDEKRQESCDQLLKKQRENDSMFENLTSLGKIKKIKHKIVFDDETDKKIKEGCLDVVADQINQENLNYLKIQASEGVEKNQESFYQLPEMQTDDDSMLKKPSTSLGAIKKIGHKMGPDDQNVKKIKKDCVDPIAEHIYQENLKYLKKQELDHVEKRQESCDQLLKKQRENDRMYENLTSLGKIKKIKHKIVFDDETDKKIKEECVDVVADQINQENLKYLKIQAGQQGEKNQESIDQLSVMERDDDSMFKEPSTSLGDIKKIRHEMGCDDQDVKKIMKDCVDPIAEHIYHENLKYLKIQEGQQGEKNQESSDQLPVMERDNDSMFKELSTSLGVIKIKHEMGPDDQNVKNIKKDGIDPIAEHIYQENLKYLKIQRLEQGEKNQESFDQLPEMQGDDDSMIKEPSTSLDAIKKILHEMGRDDQNVKKIKKDCVDPVAEQIYQEIFEYLKIQELELGKINQESFDQLPEMQRDDDRMLKEPSTSLGEIKTIKHEMGPTGQNVKNIMKDCVDPTAEHIYQENLKYLKIQELEQGEKNQESFDQLPEMQRDDDSMLKEPSTSLGAIKKIKHEMGPDDQHVKKSKKDCVDPIAEHIYQENLKYLKIQELEQGEKNQESFDQLPEMQRDDDSMLKELSTSLGAIKKIKHEMGPDDQNVKKIKKDCVDPIAEHIYQENLKYLKIQELEQGEKNQESFDQLPEMQGDDDSMIKEPSTSLGVIKIKHEMGPDGQNVKNIKKDCIDPIAEHIYQENLKYLKIQGLEQGEKNQESFDQLPEMQGDDDSMIKEPSTSLGAIKKIKHEMGPDDQNVKKTKKDCVDPIAEHIYQENLKYLKIQELEQGEKNQESFDQLPEMQGDDDSMIKEPSTSLGVIKIKHEMGPDGQNVKNIKKDCIDPIAEHIYQENLKYLKIQGLEQGEKNQESFDQLPEMQGDDDSMIKEPSTSLGVIKIKHEMGPDGQNVKNIKKDCIDPIAEHIYQENLKYLKIQGLEQGEKNQESFDQLPEMQGDDDSMIKEPSTSLGAIKKIKHEMGPDDQNVKKIKKDCVDPIAEHIYQENLKYLKIQELEQGEKNQESFDQFPEMQRDDDSMLKELSTSLDAIKKIKHEMGPDDQNVKKIKKDCVDPIAEHIYQENLKYLKIQELEQGEKNQESFDQLPEMQRDDDSMLKELSTSLGAIKKIKHEMGPDEQNVKKIKKDCVDPIAEHLYQENLKYLKIQELEQGEKNQESFDQLPEMQGDDDSMIKEPSSLVADQIVKKTKEIMARVDSMFTQNFGKVLEINAADGHKRDIQGCKINEVRKIKKGSEGFDNREMLEMKRNMPNELNKIPACIKKTRKGTMPDAHNFTQMIGVDVKLGDDEATVEEANQLFMKLNIDYDFSILIKDDPTFKGSPKEKVILDKIEKNRKEIMDHLQNLANLYENSSEAKATQGHKSGKKDHKIKGLHKFKKKNKRVGHHQEIQKKEKAMPNQPQKIPAETQKVMRDILAIFTNMLINQKVSEVHAEHRHHRADKDQIEEVDALGKPLKIEKKEETSPISMPGKPNTAMGALMVAAISLNKCEQPPYQRVQKREPTVCSEKYNQKELIGIADVENMDIDESEENPKGSVPSVLIDKNPLSTGVSSCGSAKHSDTGNAILSSYTENAMIENKISMPARLEAQEEAHRSANAASLTGSKVHKHPSQIKLRARDQILMRKVLRYNDEIQKKLVQCFKTREKFERVAVHADIFDLVLKLLDTLQTELRVPGGMVTLDSFIKLHFPEVDEKLNRLHEGLDRLRDFMRQPMN